MAKGRKTKDQKAQERSDAQHRALDDFLPKLRAVKSYAEAVALSQQSKPDTPERRVHVSLAMFLELQIAVDKTTPKEMREYLRLADAFVQEGRWTLEVANKAREHLQATIKERYYLD